LQGVRDRAPGESFRDWEPSVKEIPKWHQRLEEIVKGYPKAKAAEEAKKLLKELDE
jgi:hypothetical protein